MSTTKQVHLAERIANMDESQTLEMAKKSRELKAQGIDIINLNLGEPDFKTPAHICEAAKQAVDDGYFFYTPVTGLAELRQAIADKLKRDNQLDWKAENIIVSTGAKQSIANVMLSLVNPGEEVIIFAPYWVSYKGIVQLAEGEPNILSGKAENDYKVTAEQLREAISPKTKVVIFSSPCNPTGALFSESELRAIAEVIAENEQVYVIADEIYEYINFEGEHFSIGSIEAIKDRVITINGFSKGFAMTGWRVGYAAADLAIVKACDKIQGQVTSGTNAIAQRAAFVAISSDLQATHDMTAVYRKRADLIKGLLDNIEGFKTNTPQGAFYIFPDVSAFFGKQTPNGERIDNDMDFCMYLLNEAHVSTVAGGAFGEPNCLRISFAASDEHIKEAAKRIAEAVSKLK
ncbi:MAG: pyridoxal phosphate-dependent aminotransferase [Bernardetiaceae bacterium]|nr:pyridoxal phosphate-dependent aminotransferase [Bernardetiaceae bacterium]